MGGPKVRPGSFLEQKNLLLLLEIETRILDRSSHHADLQNANVSLCYFYQNLNTL